MESRFVAGPAQKSIINRFFAVVRLNLLSGGDLAQFQDQARFSINRRLPLRRGW